jgi:hypothetical protein
MEIKALKHKMEGMISELENKVDKKIDVKFRDISNEFN